MGAAPSFQEKVQKAADENLALPFQGGHPLLTLVPTNPTALLWTIAEEVGPTPRIEADFHGWLVEQASLLRGQRYYLLDWRNIAEELEAMAASQRRELIDLCII